MQLVSGIDIVALSTVEQLLTNHGQRFLRRTFTPAEIAYCQQKPNPLQHLAARFAAKEATFKALGSGWNGGVSWRQIEVMSTSGAPRLQLSGAALARFSAAAYQGSSLALSHITTHAVAVVTLFGR
jgi:holo-[acyl-carrier protein] synthase